MKDIKTLHNEVMYQLEVPDRERSRFESILSQLGLAASSMRRVIGHVALL